MLLGHRAVPERVRGDQRSVRRPAVIALLEVLEHQLPVGLGRGAGARDNLQVGGAVLLGHRREALDDRVEVGRLARATRLTKMNPSAVLTWRAAARSSTCRNRPASRWAPRSAPRSDRRSRRGTGSGTPACCRSTPSCLTERRAIFRRRIVVVPAHARAAMTADVVESLHLAGLVAQDDDAVAAAVLEDEVVAGLGDAALVIGHQPEVARRGTARRPGSASRRCSTPPEWSGPLPTIRRLAAAVWPAIVTELANTMLSRNSATELAASPP